MVEVSRLVHSTNIASKEDVTYLVHADKKCPLFRADDAFDVEIE